MHPQFASEDKGRIKQRCLLVVVVVACRCRAQIGSTQDTYTLGVCAIAIQISYANLPTWEGNPRPLTLNKTLFSIEWLSHPYRAYLPYFPQLLVDGHNVCLSSPPYRLGNERLASWHVTNGGSTPTSFQKPDGTRNSDLSSSCHQERIFPF